MIVSHKVRFLFCLVISISLFNSCISRLSRPAITGYIYNYDNTPVAGCKVAEAETDAQGYFYLEEQRTNRFLLTEMLSMEAPPVFFTLDIEKEGYQSYQNDFFQRHGGGRQKGALDNIDTLYIKRVGEQIPIERYLYEDWTFSANKNLDTLYGINKNYRIQNIISNTSGFQDKYGWGQVYRYKSTSIPDSSWSTESYDLLTSLDISLQKEGTYEGKKTRKYLNPWRHRKEYERTYREAYKIPSDSSYSKGRFTISGDIIRFDKRFVKANAVYQIDSIDRDILILICKPD
ncbi:hypothetical protein CLV99_0573 [Sphingobacterium yanglingense]|uniref:Uncharacterized protein n=1 Tax=Sphingobacterium yanglingense TaxID=1437280 RepID=A0A4R6WM27_9SPHI|nr:hypothetical protein CLV99_0573 [Sphingobacterium yanglingense]